MTNSLNPVDYIDPEIESKINSQSIKEGSGFIFRSNLPIKSAWWNLIKTKSSAENQKGLTLIPLGGRPLWPPPPVVFFAVHLDRLEFHYFFLSSLPDILIYNSPRFGHVELILEVDNCSTVTKKLQFLYRFLCNSYIQCHVNSRSVIIVTLNYNFDYFFVISLFHTLQR